MIKRILFVQHHKEVSALFACMIRELGYEVSLAAGLDESHRQLNSKPHDLIMIEGACPDCDPLEFAKKVRNGDFGPGYIEAPILVFDSFDRINEESLAMARRKGLIQRYFKLPIIADELTIRLSSILGNRDPADAVLVLSFEFEQKNLARLILTAFKFRFSGQMCLTADGISKTLFFDSGRLTSASSLLTTDRIGNLMIVKGAINENQLNEALIATETNGKMIGEELVARGWINDDQLHLSLIEQSERIVQSLFLWENFELSFSREPGDPPPGVSIPLNPFTMISNIIRATFSPDELLSLLPASDHFLIPCFESPIRFSRLPLKDEEKRAVELIDGQTLYLSFLDRVDLSETDARFLVATLLYCGFLEVSTEPSQQPIYLGRNPDPTNLAKIFEDEFFSSQTIKADPNEPPPISSEELAKELQKLDEDEPDELATLDSVVLEEETFRDIEGMKARRANPVSYLVIVAFILGAVGIAISFLSIHSGPPKNLSKQKNVDDIGGDLKPLFTEAIDLYNTGIENMKSSKLSDLKEAKRCFILSLEIVPDYSPAEKALEEVEEKIELIEKKKSAPASKPSVAKETTPS